VRIAVRIDELVWDEWNVEHISMSAARPAAGPRNYRRPSGSWLTGLRHWCVRCSFLLLH